MVRSKLSLKLIGDSRRRNATFMKRRSGLKKKAMELSTLCDVPTLLVCFGPHGQTEVWPEDRGEACSVIHRLRCASAEDRGKHKYDISSFFGHHATVQTAAENKVHLGGSLHWPEEQLLGEMPDSSLQALESALEAKLKAIEERIGVLQGELASSSLQGGAQSAEGWQQAEQGMWQYSLMGTNPAGEESMDYTGLSWGRVRLDECPGNPNGNLEENPAADLGGFGQDMLQTLMHGGREAVPPPPPPSPTSYNSMTFIAPYFQPHGDVVAGTLGGLYNQYVSTALARYPHQHDGYRTGCHLGGTACSAPATAATAMALAFVPPSPTTLFLDYNGAGGSAMMKCCSSHCPVMVPGDAVLLGGGGGGRREQVASSSSGSNGDAVQQRQGGFHGCGTIGLVQEEFSLDEALENPSGSSVCPGYPLGAPAAGPLAFDGHWAGFPGN